MDLCNFRFASGILLLPVILIASACSGSSGESEFKNTIVNPTGGGDGGNGGEEENNLGSGTPSLTLSDAKPFGTLASSTTTVNLELTSNNKAQCKYSDSPNQDFDAMPNTFENTDSTSHSTEVASLRGGQNYSFYVKCKDEFNQINSTDLKIAFVVSSVMQPPVTTHSLQLASKPQEILATSLFMSKSDGQALSQDGRYLAFTSGSKVIPGVEIGNIYRYDFQTDEVKLVSSKDGTAATQVGKFAKCDSPSISGDGRYIAFACNGQQNLFSNISFSSIIVRKDMQTGELALVNVPHPNAPPSSLNSLAARPIISRSGSVILFYSGTTLKYFPTISEAESVVSKNMVTNEMKLVSSANGGFTTPINLNSTYYSVSANGDFATFLASNSGIVPQVSTTTRSHIYRKNMIDGSIRLVSADKLDDSTAGNADSSKHQISASGRYVAFYTEATNLGGASGGRIVVRDLEANVESETIKTVSTTSSLSVNVSDEVPAISDDGKFISFSGSVGSSIAHTYRRDMSSINILKVSNDAVGAATESSFRVLGASADGAIVAFHASQINSNPVGANVYIRHITSNSTTRAVRSGVSFFESAQPALYGQLTSDGKEAFFYTPAENIVSTGANTSRWYKKNLESGDIRRVATSISGEFNPGSNFKISENGRYGVFTSNYIFAPSIPTMTQTVRVDMTTHSFENVSVSLGVGNCVEPSISADGQFVACAWSSRNDINRTNAEVYIKDMQTNTIEKVAGGSVIDSIRVSRFGRYVFFKATPHSYVTDATINTVQIYRKDMVTKEVIAATSQVMTNTTENLGLTGDFEISQDGQFIVYTVNKAGGCKENYWKNVSTGETRSLKSLRTNEPSGAVCSSRQESASISADGNTVVETDLSIVSGFDTYRLFRYKLASLNAEVVYSASIPSSSNLLEALILSADISSDGSTIIFSGNRSDFISGVVGIQTYVQRLN